MMSSESKKDERSATTLAPRIIRRESVSEVAGGKIISTKELFGSGNQSLLIEHEGAIYCLRATKFGKLLITK